MNKFRLKGFDKNGVVKYQSRVYMNIDKIKSLRTMNKLSFQKLTFIIYNLEGKVIPL